MWFVVCLPPPIKNPGYQGRRQLREIGGTKLKLGGEKVFAVFRRLFLAEILTFFPAKSRWSPKKKKKKEKGFFWRKLQISTFFSAKKSNFFLPKNTVVGQEINRGGKNENRGGLAPLPPPPPRWWRTCWVCLWPVPNVVFQATTVCIIFRFWIESLKKTEKTKNYRQSNDLQLSEITVTRKAIGNRYCYRHCYWKQQSLWLLTAASDIIKIQCFLRKILRNFNLFLHVNQIVKYVVKRSNKSPQHVLG